MSDELSDLIQGFVEESHESFEAIENDLLAIEENPDDLNIVNGIFRVLHTIKGTAGFMGLDDINRLSHKLESIFDMIRKEELGITPELLDSLLPAIDLLKLMVFELVEDQRSDYQLAETTKLLETIIESEGREIPQASQPEEEQEAPDEPVETLEAPEPEPEQPEEEGIPVSDELLQEFVVEAEEHLETIEEGLLRLEKNPSDEESIHEVFRGTHSIKGIAGYVSLGKITRLAHRLETIFDALRKGSAKYTNEMADQVLKGLDLLRTLIMMIKMGESYDVIEVDGVIAQLEQFVAKKPTPEAKPQKAASPQAAPSGQSTKSSQGAQSEQAKPKGPVDGGKYQPFKNLCKQQTLTLQAIGAEVIAGEAGEDELVMLDRAVKTIQNGASKFGLGQVSEQTGYLIEYIQALLKGEKSAEELATELQDKLGTLAHLLEIIDGSSQAEIDQMTLMHSATPKQTPAPKTETKPALKEEAQAPATPKDNEIKTMRVDANRLDVFMNLIGELIIARNSLNHTLGEVPQHLVPQELLASLKTVEGSFNRISEDLQNTLMDLRLMPVKTVFQKIPRIVRDIARKTGKQIQIQTFGENTQIDKSIIEVIGDPLIHIIRNSCDHGIESPEVRATAGKPEQGSIILKAQNLGSSIAIDIIDDGAGINTDKVLKSAINKGLVRPEQAKHLDKKTINQFIFHPGFSTADKVSDISGRGVGMDVVISNITKVNGTVDVESEMGAGTQIRLTLPLTLAVIDALLIEESGQKYAIPLESVKESIEIKESELQHLKKKEAINLRGDIIGVARLAELLELPPKPPKKGDEVVSVVFVQAGNRIMGVVVDDLSNQQEIVVKPLQSYLAQIPGISGSTILGSGEIILILSPGELVDLAAQ